MVRTGDHRAGYPRTSSRRSYTPPWYFPRNIPRLGMSVKKGVWSGESPSSEEGGEDELGKGRMCRPSRGGLERLISITLAGYSLDMETGNMIHATAQSETAPARRSTSYAHDKAKILTRLRRIEGQVRGVQKMVEEDQYCIDVLTQLSAVIAGARAAGLLVLEDHIRGCVMDTCRHGHQSQEAMLEELSEAIERFTRSAS